ncbi:VP1 [Gokushovirus WZ-2015a]|nr:VP1 [Gokushovirus WZ-2015a]
MMDNMYLDTYWFFVPNRLVWNHWEEFCGENKTGPWSQKVEYTVPTIGCPVDSSGALLHFESGTLADYMGLPIGSLWKPTDALAPSALPFRAYSLIINNFFRDENFANPLLVNLDDANVSGSNDAPFGPNQNLSACSLGGKPYLANKYHDYFTSALPSSQKGSPVEIPINVPGFAGGTFPVVTGANLNYDVGDSGFPLLTLLTPSYSTTNPKADPNNPAALPLSNKGFLRDISGDGSTQCPVYNRSDADYRGIVPANLQTTIPPAGNSEGSDVSFSINQFRLAYVYQCYLEAIARSGSRYGEMIQAIFGVTNPDSRLQLPEYLGGNRVPINISEVTNVSQAEKDFLGDVGAKSNTTDINHDFVKSFTEHGILMGLMVVRYDHSYSQGLERFWTRHKYTDFYNPMFANLGETPIYKAEIYAGNEAAYSETAPINNPESTFGYQEIWADLRYKPNRISGEMRPGVKNSLAYWHLGDYYKSEPTISESWLFEDKTNVDRVLAVTSEVANQFWFDVYVQNRCTRCMPMYSVPGLEPKF